MSGFWVSLTNKIKQSKNHEVFSSKPCSEQSIKQKGDPDSPSPNKLIYTAKDLIYSSV